MKGYHSPIRARPHPDGEPLGYCVACSRAVVRVAGRLWHITDKARNKQDDAGRRPKA